MMVGSWPCRVSSKVHINEQRVSDPVRGDKDLKRACVVSFQDHEVVGLGYSKLSSATALETNKGRCLDNLNWVT
jgi:hypothetical protein